MSINKIRFLGMLALFSVCGCSNDLFLTHNGNMPSNERIAKVKVGRRIFRPEYMDIYVVRH